MGIGIVYGVIGFQFILFIIHCYKTSQLLKRADSILDFEELQKVRLDLARKIENPSTEVRDLMRDCQAHGFSFLRVDPSAVFIRNKGG